MYKGASREDFQRDYQKDKEIDKYDLDNECMVQASIFDYWCRLEKIAASKVDELETNLAALKSLIELEIKGMEIEDINKKYSLELKDGERITDRMASNIRRQDKRVKEMVDDLRKAKHDYNIALAARMSFQQKKDMLDNLVKLHGQGYFSKVEGKDYHNRKVTSQRQSLADAISKSRAGSRKRVRNNG